MLRLRALLEDYRDMYGADQTPIHLDDAVKTTFTETQLVLFSRFAELYKEGSRHMAEMNRVAHRHRKRLRGTVTNIKTSMERLGTAIGYPGIKSVQDGYDWRCVWGQGTIANIQLYLQQFNATESALSADPTLRKYQAILMKIKLA